MLASRVSAATRWVSVQPATRGLGIGLFGSSTGAAAALAAAAENPELVAAVVSRGGRPDLVPPPLLARIEAQVLLLVGSRDEPVLRLNQSVVGRIRSAQLTVVPGATHLFEEPGALEQVARLAVGWFTGRLGVFAPGASWSRAQVR
jgi:dienelactone hydrolase